MSWREEGADRNKVRQRNWKTLTSSHTLFTFLPINGLPLKTKITFLGGYPLDCLEDKLRGTMAWTIFCGYFHVDQEKFLWPQRGKLKGLACCLCVKKQTKKQTNLQHTNKLTKLHWSKRGFVCFWPVWLSIHVTAAQQTMRAGYNWCRIEASTVKTVQCDLSKRSEYVILSKLYNFPGLQLYFQKISWLFKIPRCL